MARQIDWASLVRAAAGPEPMVRVYDFRRPKYERPNHNPFDGIVPDVNPVPQPDDPPGGPA